MEFRFRRFIINAVARSLTFAWSMAAEETGIHSFTFTISFICYLIFTVVLFDVCRLFGTEISILFE
jgi:hypothetical protein